MAKKDYYETLGISKDASTEDIRKAYKSLVKKWHPDLHADKKEEAEQKFKDIREAYEILSDSQKRAQYDRFGYVGQSEAQQGWSSQGGGPFNQDLFGGFEDLFGTFFGQNFGGSNASSKVYKGEDTYATVIMDLKDVLYGVEREVEYTRNETCKSCSGTGAKDGTAFKTCPKCHGSGVVRNQQRTFFGVMTTQGVCDVCGGSGKQITEKCTVCGGQGYNAAKKRVKVKIPSGVEDGSRMRVANGGHVGPNNGPYGDLFVMIKVKGIPGIKRDGRNLYSEVDIDFAEAALGTSVDIDGLEGPETLKINSGTQPGAILKMHGKGLPSVNGNMRGDHIVKVNVTIPKKLKKEQEELLRKYAEISGSEPKEKRHGFFRR